MSRLLPRSAVSREEQQAEGLSLSAAGPLIKMENEYGMIGATLNSFPIIPLPRKMMEHISFTVTGRIDSTATANFTHLTFRLGSGLHAYQLIKCQSGTYVFVINIGNQS